MKLEKVLKTVFVIIAVILLSVVLFSYIIVD